MVARAIRPRPGSEYGAEPLHGRGEAEMQIEEREEERLQEEAERELRRQYGGEDDEGEDAPPIQEDAGEDDVEARGYADGGVVGGSLLDRVNAALADGEQQQEEPPARRAGSLLDRVQEALGESAPPPETAIRPDAASEPENPLRDVSPEFGGPGSGQTAVGPPPPDWSEVVDKSPAGMVAAGRGAAHNFVGALAESARQDAARGISDIRGAQRRAAAAPEGARAISLEDPRDIHDERRPLRRRPPRTPLDPALLPHYEGVLAEATKVGEQAQKDAAQAKKDLELVTPKDMNVPQQAFWSFVQSAPPTLLGIGIGIATRNPGLAMAVAGGGGAAFQGGSTYGEAMEMLLKRGLPREEAHRVAMDAAVVAGSLEGLGETVPLAAAFKPGTPFFSRMANVIWQESGQEGLTQLGQDLHAYLAYNPDITAKEALHNLQVAILAGAMGGTVYGAAGQAGQASTPQEVVARELRDSVEGARFRRPASEVADEIATSARPRVEGQPAAPQQDDVAIAPRPGAAMPAGGAQEPPEETAVASPDAMARMTNRLPDGTLVEPKVEDGQPVPGLWVDARGTIIEAPRADPLKQEPNAEWATGGTMYPVQITGKGRAPDTARLADGQEVPFAQLKMDEEARTLLGLIPPEEPKAAPAVAEESPAPAAAAVEPKESPAPPSREAEPPPPRSSPAEAKAGPTVPIEQVSRENKEALASPSFKKVLDEAVAQAKGRKQAKVPVYFDDQGRVRGFGSSMKLPQDVYEEVYAGRLSVGNLVVDVETGEVRKLEPSNNVTEQGLRRATETMVPALSKKEESRRAALKAKAKKARTVDLDRDGIVAAIIKVGGIDRELQNDVAPDANPSIPWVGTLFRKADTGGTRSGARFGHGLDGIVEKLVGLGYLTQAEVDSGKANVHNTVIEMIRADLAGTPQYSHERDPNIEAEERAKNDEEYEKFLAESGQKLEGTGIEDDPVVAPEDFADEDVEPSGIRLAITEAAARLPEKVAAEIFAIHGDSETELLDALLTEVQNYEEGTVEPGRDAEDRGTGEGAPAGAAEAEGREAAQGGQGAARAGQQEQGRVQQAVQADRRTEVGGKDAEQPKGQYTVDQVRAEQASDPIGSVAEAHRLIEAGKLKQIPERAGRCYLYSARAVIRTPSSMMSIGIMNDGHGRRIWHGVVQLAQGSLHEPTLARVFAPGVYEALQGYRAIVRLTPREVVAFNRDKGFIPDPATMEMPYGEQAYLSSANEKAVIEWNERRLLEQPRGVYRIELGHWTGEPLSGTLKWEKAQRGKYIGYLGEKAVAAVTHEGVVDETRHVYAVSIEGWVWRDGSSEREVSSAALGQRYADQVLADDRAKRVQVESERQYIKGEKKPPTTKEKLAAIPADARAKMPQPRSVPVLPPHEIDEGTWIKGLDFEVGMIHARRVLIWSHQADGSDDAKDIPPFSVIADGKVIGSAESMEEAKALASEFNPRDPYRAEQPLAPYELNQIGEALDALPGLILAYEKMGATRQAAALREMQLQLQRVRDGNGGVFYSPKGKLQTPWLVALRYNLDRHANGLPLGNPFFRPPSEKKRIEELMRAADVQRLSSRTGWTVTDAEKRAFRRRLREQMGKKDDKAEQEEGKYTADGKLVIDRALDYTVDELLAAGKRAFAVGEQAAKTLNSKGLTKEALDAAVEDFQWASWVTQEIGVLVSRNTPIPADQPEIDWGDGKKRKVDHNIEGRAKWDELGLTSEKLEALLPKTKEKEVLRMGTSHRAPDAAISLLESENGLWAVGTEHTLPTRGSYSGPWLVYSPTFLTRAEALAAGIARLREVKPETSSMASKSDKDGVKKIHDWLDKIEAQGKDLFATSVPAKPLGSIKVRMTVVEAETGRELTMLEPADEAIADVDGRITKVLELLECIRS